LEVSIDGVKKGEVASKDLSDAFVAIYVDSKAVSPSLKKDLAKTVRGWF